MKIAGKNTDEHWRTLKATLQVGGTPELWERAFDEFHGLRIQTRYRTPIDRILAKDEDLGEGFAIGALFCSLVEFLESTEQGKNYVYEDSDPARFEYSGSRRMFKDFLKNQEPFKSEIPSHLVDSFYSGLRCGLLHEARTKDGWLFSAEKSGGKLVREDGTKKILYRNELFPMLDRYLADYRQRLRSDIKTQEAFIRKWDDLAKP